MAIVMGDEDSTGKLTRKHLPLEEQIFSIFAPDRVVAAICGYLFHGSGSGETLDINFISLDFISGRVCQPVSIGRESSVRFDVDVGARAIN